MIAGVLTNPKTFQIKDVKEPVISATEIKVRLEGCGICSSSIPLWEGREWFQYPVEAGTPGHEGWGIVDETGENVTEFQRGDRVAFLSNHAFAEFDKTSAEAAVKLPSALANMPFPGEPLGCAMNIFERSRINEGDIVAIIGSGFLGTLLCSLCKNAGAKVIAISRRQYALDVAANSGADETIILNDTWQVANQVAEITGNQFCARVIEATGKQAGIDIATELVAEGGLLIIAGYHQDGLRQVNMQKWNWKGIDVINAHERDVRRYVSGMHKAIEAVENGTIDPSKLYTDSLSLDELSTGFEMTSSRPEGFMKALIQF